MGDTPLTVVLKKYILAVTALLNKEGDKKVCHYFFSKRYHSGCSDHPDLKEHGQIAEELSAYLKRLMRW
jgi:hypothetical protein